MKFAIWNEHFDDRSIEEAFEFIASAGYDAVEVTPWTFTDSIEDASDEEVDRVTSAAAENDLAITGLARVFSGEPDYHVTRPDERVRERTVEYFVALADLCGRLGGFQMTFGAPRQRNVPEGVDADTAWENAQSVFGHEDLLDALERNDVTFNIEPMTPPVSNFLTSTPETIEFVEEVDHPNVGLTLDGYYLVNEEPSPADTIREAGDHLTHFHADDPEGRGPGSGDLDFGPILEALDDIGYDTYVAVEFHTLLGREPVEEGADADEMATDSIKYLRACAESV